MKILNSNKEGRWNSITEFFVVLAFLGFALSSIMSSFIIANSPINIINVAISLFMVYITLRLLDNSRIAMYVFFAYLLTEVILSFVMPETITQKWIVTFVLYALSFCLTKNGKTTWSIIYKSPQDRIMDVKDKKLFYIISAISGLVAVIGFLIEIVTNDSC